MIPPDCIPEGNEFVMETLDFPDRLGRCMFYLYWNTDYIAGHPDPKPIMTRAQCFFARPTEYIKNKNIKRIIDRYHKRDYLI